MFKPLVFVPFFNHFREFEKFAPRLRAGAAGAPILVVDDGSDLAEAVALATLCRAQNFRLLRKEKNCGKGAAMKTALEFAAGNGFSHALQIDADGQHAAEDIPKFFAAAKKNPGAVINGTPVYDASAPRSRTLGRKITTFWVALETRSRAIGDAMCGFRVYPAAELAARGVLRRLRSAGMSGDIEIIVRAFHAGVPVVNLPTKVVYPAASVSHFRLFADNVAVSRTHARLFLESLFWRKK